MFDNVIKYLTDSTTCNDLNSDSNFHWQHTLKVALQNTLPRVQSYHSWKKKTLNGFILYSIM
jgi:hypothetical protein